MSNRQQPGQQAGLRVRLRPWVSMAGWRAVRAVMEAAPTPRHKRLRHGFGVTAVSAGIPAEPGAEVADHVQLSP